jgi:hypothetical protein
MNCNPCLPEITVKCLTAGEDPSQTYALWIEGLEDGESYYLKLTSKLGNTYIKAFVYSAGSPVEISIDDFPDLLVGGAQVKVEVTADTATGLPIPVLFTHRVTGINLTISCDEVYGGDIGEPTI